MVWFWKWTNKCKWNIYVFCMLYVFLFHKLKAQSFNHVITSPYWCKAPIESISPDSKVHGAHLGPVGPRCAPCWPHEPCCLGSYNQVPNVIDPWYTRVWRFRHYTCNDCKISIQYRGPRSGLSWASTCICASQLYNYQDSNAVRYKKKSNCDRWKIIVINAIPTAHYQRRWILIYHYPVPCRQTMTG